MFCANAMSFVVVVGTSFVPLPKVSSAGVFVVLVLCAIAVAGVSASNATATATRRLVLVISLAFPVIKAQLTRGFS
jgi:hypothetical protein